MAGVTDYVMAEPQPWATMDRQELIGRLSSIADMHDLPPTPVGPFEAQHCRCCLEIHPCASRIVATGVIE